MDQCEWNTDRTARLCTEKSVDPKTKMESLSYAIYTGDEEVMREGTLNGGYIRWMDDEAIEIFQPPGMMRENTKMEDYVRVLVVRSGEMTTKQEYLKRINNASTPSDN